MEFSDFSNCVGDNTIFKMKKTKRFGRNESFA